MREMSDSSKSQPWPYLCVSLPTNTITHSFMSLALILYILFCLCFWFLFWSVLLIAMNVRIFFRNKFCMNKWNHISLFPIHRDSEFSFLEIVRYAFLSLHLSHRSVLKMECSMLFFLVDSFFAVVCSFVYLLFFAIFWSGCDLATHWTWTKINLDVNKLRKKRKNNTDPNIKQKWIIYEWMNSTGSIQKDFKWRTLIANWHLILANKKRVQSVFVSSF